MKKCDKDYQRRYREKNRVRIAFNRNRPEAKERRRQYDARRYKLKKLQDLICELLEINSKH